MMVPRRAAALLAATLIAAQLPANAPRSAPPLATLSLPTPAAAGTSPLDFEPVPSPRGATAAETLNLADALAAMVEQNPGTMTGVRVDGPKSLVLTVPEGADIDAVQQAVQREAARATSGPAAVSVRVQRVARSRAEMNKTRAEVEILWLSGAYGSQIVGVGSDPSRGVIVVYATEDSLSTRASIKDRFGDAVVFRRMTAARAA